MEQDLETDQEKITNELLGACQRNDIVTVKEMVDKGLHVFKTSESFSHINDGKPMTFTTLVRDQDGFNPLTVCCLNGHTDLFKFMCDHIQDPADWMGGALHLTKAYPCLFYAHLFKVRGIIDFVNERFKDGKKVNKYYKNPMDVLLFSTDHQFGIWMSVYEKMFKQKIEMDTADIIDYTGAFSWYNGHHNKPEDRYLLKACFDNNLESATHIVNNRTSKLDINCVDERGFTPLQSVLQCSKGDQKTLDFFKLILNQEGVEVNKRNKDYETVLDMLENLEDFDLEYFCPQESEIHKLLVKHGAESS
jgi:ankyrin repeat protein